MPMTSNDDELTSYTEITVDGTNNTSETRRTTS